MIAGKISQSLNGACLLLSQPMMGVVCLLFLLSGCGSKINEANYVRVIAGMEEKEVIDLLGPGQNISPSRVGLNCESARQWSRDGLTITIGFDNGKVVARKGEGLTGEDDQFGFPSPASQQAG